MISMLPNTDPLFLLGALIIVCITSVFTFYKLGYKRFATGLIYLYYLNKFIYLLDSYINNITLSTLFILSLFSFVNYYRNIDVKFSNNFIITVTKLFSSPKCVLLILVLTFGLAGLFKMFIKDILGITYSDIGVILFVNFSLIIPMSILSRIIYNAIFELYLSNDIGFATIFTIIIFQFFTLDNYKLPNINNVITVFINIFLPVLECCDLIIPYDDNMHRLNTIDQYYIYRCMFDNESNNALLFPIASYDDISYPDGYFTNLLDLNVRSSKTLIELQNDNNAIPVEVQTSMGPKYDRTFKLGTDTWVRSNNDLFFKSSYIKGIFIKQIDDVTSVNYYLPNGIYNLDLSRKCYINNQAITNKYEDLSRNGRYEDKVDALVSTLLPHFFGSNRGYGYNPQYRDTGEINVESEGKMDNMVDYNKTPILIVEDKTTSKSSSSFINLLAQAGRYARNNFMDVSFVMAVKVTDFAFFMYDLDYHAKHGLDLKGEEYEDLVGLQVLSEGISIIPQLNTFYPQIRVYDSAPHSSITDTLAVSTILSLISHFDEPQSILDGPTIPASKDSAVLGTCFRPGIGPTSLQVDPFGKFK